MKYRILIEVDVEGKSSFVDAGLPVFDAEDGEAIQAELDRLKTETGVCHSAEVVE